MVNPILKWAGGKRRIIDILKSMVPDRYETYFEPFFGGGALFFSLWNEYREEKSVVSDKSADLYNLYSIVRDKPDLLLKEISGLQYGNHAGDYYSARTEFNSLGAEDDPVRKAVLLIYLNRHCYNGLFRLNSRGEFNVPFGKYRLPSLPSGSQIMEASEALQSARILQSDFEEVLRLTRSGDFVYLDPPYAPLSRTSAFTNYGSNGFDQKDQERLAGCVKRIDQRGVYFVLSNSSAPEIINLYSGFNFRTVGVSRAINSRSELRGPVNELIITNL